MGEKRKNLGRQNRQTAGLENDPTSRGAIEPEYLSLDELARYACVCKKTLRKWIGCGMPTYKVGHVVRIKKGEFDAWLKQFRSGTSKDLEEVWDQVMKEV